MKYWYLYIPAAVFFLLPVLNALHASAKERTAAREKEAKRAAAAAAKKAAKEAQAAAPAVPAADPAPAPAPRKRGRPRKNPLPEPQRPEIISNDPAPAPVQVVTIQRASIFPDINKMEPPCSPEEFAARIG